MSRQSRTLSWQEGVSGHSGHGWMMCPMYSWLGSVKGTKQHGWRHRAYLILEVHISYHIISERSRAQGWGLGTTWSEQLVWNAAATDGYWWQGIRIVLMGQDVTMGCPRSKPHDGLSWSSELSREDRSSCSTSEPTETGCLGRAVSANGPTRLGLSWWTGLLDSAGSMEGAYSIE